MFVATNCGHYGGSFAWSPQSGEGKELARLRGNHLLVLADVELPVRALVEQQQNGTERALLREMESTWSPEGAVEAEIARFKSPPRATHLAFNQPLAEEGRRLNLLDAKHPAHHVRSPNPLENRHRNPCLNVRQATLKARAKAISSGNPRRTSAASHSRCRAPSGVSVHPPA